MAFGPVLCQPKNKVKVDIGDINSSTSSLQSSYFNKSLQ